jgi:hypothetical protein
VPSSVERKTYQVQAQRWQHGWELHIHGLGVTQSYGKADAEAMVREFVHLNTDAAPDSFDVEIVYDEA